MINKTQNTIPNRDNVANKQLLFFESLNAFVNTISDSTNKTEKSVTVYSTKTRIKTFHRKITHALLESTTTIPLKQGLRQPPLNYRRRQL